MNNSTDDRDNSRFLWIGAGIASILACLISCIIGILIGEMMAQRRPADQIAKNDPAKNKSPETPEKKTDEISDKKDAVEKIAPKVDPMLPKKGELPAIERKKLIGKWETGSESIGKFDFNVVWQFNADGTGKSPFGFGKMEWSMSDDIINIDATGMRFRFRARLEDGNKLILTPVADDAAKGSPTYVLKRVDNP